jgi:crotonobetainyl-CoA:carnitine CoA-transferase CaiB-like acyl-CoA transferase
MRALDGINVIEFGDGVAVGYCGALLAAAGAEVVKIEAPSQGDAARRLPPFKPGVAAPEASGMHAFLAANKASVALDLTQADGAALALRLCQNADIVLEALGPGVADGLGLGLAKLKASNPALTMTALSWFGQDGPRRDWAASDAIVQALSGFIYPIGEKAGPPIIPGGYQAQITAGMTAFIATMSALVGGLAGDEGAYIDQSILEAQTTYTENGGVRTAYGDPPTPRKGLNKFHPTYPQTLFPAADGWIGVTVLTPLQWRNCCNLIGAPELINDPRFSTSVDRNQRADELEEILIPYFLKRPALEWFNEAQAQRVPFAIVPTMADLADLDHFQTRGIIADYNHPDLGTFTAATIPWKLQGTPLKVGGAAARLGQDTATVLSHRLGLVSDDIARLAATGVIGLEAQL